MAVVLVCRHSGHPATLLGRPFGYRTRTRRHSANNHSKDWFGGGANVRNALMISKI